MYLRYHCCLPCWSEEIYFKYSKESDNQVWSRNHKHWRRVWHKHGKIHGSSGWRVFIYLDLYDKERSKGVYWRICWWQANCLDVHVWTDCSLGKYYWKLVIRMKKGSQFWTPNSESQVAYIHNYYTYLSGFKISDKWFHFLIVNIALFEIWSNFEDCLQ